MARREKGTGGISQRKDGSWQGRFDVGISPEGKRIVKSVYAKTEAECKRKLHELIKETHKSDYIVVQKNSVREYMTKWLTTVKVNDLKPKSYDRLEQTLTLDVFPSIGEIQLQALTTDHVQNMINKLRADGRSHSSIKKAYDAVNACFKHGVIQRTVAFNPASGVAVPGKSSFKQKQVPFYTKEEAQALCTRAMSSWGNGKRRYPLGAFVPLLINTGLRMGELLSLQWKRDVDLKNNIITVHANMAIVRDRSGDAKSKYKLIEQDTVKSQAGQDRSIRLNDAAIEAINDLHKATGQYTNVMTTSNGTIVKPRQLDQMFRRIATASGLPEDKIYGVHALRHTFATLLLNSGTDIKTVSKLMGHSDITITYNTYIHVMKELEIKALNSIPNLMS